MVDKLPEAGLIEELRSKFENFDSNNDSASITTTIDTSNPSDSEVVSEQGIVDFLQEHGISGNAVPREGSGFDLNSISENKVIECNGGLIGNSPIATSRLWVETWVRAQTTDDRYQIAWDMNSNGRYERSCVGGPSNYTDWKRLLTEDDGGTVSGNVITWTFQENSGGADGSREVEVNDSGSQDTLPIRIAATYSDTTRQAYALNVFRENTDTGGTSGSLTFGHRVDSVMGVDSVHRIWSILGTVENNADTEFGNGCTAVYGQSNKNSSGSTFAGVFETDDNTNSGNAVGIEVNMGCTGTTSGKRSLGTFIAKTPIGETTGVVDEGINIRTSLAVESQIDPARILTALRISEGTAAGDIVEGINVHIQGANLFKGTRKSGPGNIEVGSEDTANNSIISDIISRGGNSSSSTSDTAYSRIQSLIRDNSSGSEDGSIRIVARSNGSDLTGMEIRGNSATNPFFLRVGGSVKQVTEGAADSAESGFRQLRVPN